ncbi:putative glycolipid-binding domain-containing protein [soil metagenome]
MTELRMLCWRGPEPQRIDSAHVSLGTDFLRAHGTSLTASYALDYRLETEPGWVTSELDVGSRGDGWWRSLVLRRSGGEWSADWAGEGLGALPARLPDLEGALDCDLGLCPLTNTMPVLRHDLVGASHRGAGGSHDLVMAWVSVPDLTVRRSDQRYAVSDPIDEGGALVVYGSEDFRTTIEFDADGLVVNYPGLGRRVE